MRTIEDARNIIANLAEIDGEYKFAREVRDGVWDHRNDVKSAMKPTFRHLSMDIPKS